MAKQFASNGPVSIQCEIVLSHLSDGKWIAQAGNGLLRSEDGSLIPEIGGRSGEKAYGATGEAARSAFQALALRALANQIEADRSTVDNIYFCVTIG
jgi:hypothetical protein